MESYCKVMMHVCPKNVLRREEGGGRIVLRCK